MKLPADWPSLTALELGRRIEAGTLDPVMLTEAALDRISRHDPHGKTFYALLSDRALTEAIAAHDRARRGLRRSPLDGVPLAVKDNIEAVGGATTNGSKLFEHHVAGEDAPVLQRLSRAGLVTLGKTALTEFAFSGLGYNPTMGSPTCAFDPDVKRAPGGSSAGSAVAVARGLAPIAVGTDTAGSVRIPAAWNGLVGFKPAYGTLPLEGIFPLSRTRDSVGPLARDVADAWALWAALSRSDAPQPPAMALPRINLIWPMEVEADLFPNVADTIEHALSKLARKGVTITQDSFPVWADTQATFDNMILPTAAEVWAEWGDAVDDNPDAVYAEVRERMRTGKNLSGPEFAASISAFADLARAFRAEVAPFDAIVMPTMLGLPPRLSRLEDTESYTRENMRALRLTRVANFTDLCAITLPCGTAKPPHGDHGLPVGLMLMAPAGEEAKLFALAAAMEPILPRPELPIF